LSSGACEQSPVRALVDGVLTPLTACPELKEKVHCIVVDSLDESHTSAGRTTIAELLLHDAVQHALPHNLRIIATSRNEGPITSMFMWAGTPMDLHCSDNVKDLELFCTTQIWTKPLFSKATLQFPSRSPAQAVKKAADLVLTKSGNNFLTLNLILKTIAESNRAGSIFTGEPFGHDDLHRTSLDRLWTMALERLQGWAAWPTCQILLSLLLTEPNATKQQLVCALTMFGVPESEIAHAMAALADCLDETTMSFRHKSSVAEMLSRQGRQFGVDRFRGNQIWTCCKLIALLDSPTVACHRFVGRVLGLAQVSVHSYHRASFASANEETERELLVSAAALFARDSPTGMSNCCKLLRRLAPGSIALRLC
jgi:hypothetical protein